MKVVVDTSVWSLALRRPTPQLTPPEGRLVNKLRELIDEFRVVMVGSIRQELLSGIPVQSEFERILRQLRPFPDEPLASEDYEEAAAIDNRCRAAGVAALAVDVLLCAVAISRGAAILTADRDLERYAEVVPLRLLSVETLD